ncbi:MAG: hypothetical protein B7733_20055 [Myxococcales bacterium FL481]|nr:MAG: hypothetical protein B7733_20055 [Myxococcales bacterium FL481]
MTNAPPQRHIERLADLSPGDEGLFTAFAYLGRVRAGQTKDGRPFADVELSDASARVGAKVWADTPKALAELDDVTVGEVVKLRFEARSYRGALQLRITRIRPTTVDDDYDRTAVLGEGYDRIEGLAFRTLVFDIETVPNTDLRRVPPTIAQAVSKHAERNDGDETKVMSLSPLFGKVVSVAVGEGEGPVADCQPTVLVVPPPGADVEAFPGWMRPMSEPELLRCFWLLAQRAELVVSFNGRGFDVPFLVARSLVHKIAARVDLLSNPYALRPHLDLYRVLQPGGRGLGPASLDVLCWALGYASPKGEMDGSMVAPTYARGDITTIAEYNAGDVVATTAVYQHLREHLLRYRADW